MDENNSLDQLVTEPQKDAQDVFNRPRLRKIKRPKIRPAPDLPSAPQKVFEEEQEATMDIPADSSEADSVSNDTNSGTDLVAAKDIHELLQERQTPNPYIVDSLPPDFSTDDMLNETADDDMPVMNEKKMRMKLFLFSLAFFLIGILFQALFFSSPVEEKYGLEGVILNQDVPAGRPRCGLTEKTQACVFYLMNCYKQELTGRDFYKLAAQLTGREEYMIETENLHYAMAKIKPGHFAQINIPALE